LEITLWPAQTRAWFKVQSGRRAPWIDLMVPKLKESLETSSARNRPTRSKLEREL
jgi:hypothetical protein